MTLKRHHYQADLYILMDKQNGLCADPLCKKRNGKILSVSNTKDIDHTFPIKLWELMKKKGNPNNISNLQLLCPICHRIKTAYDKKRVAEYKKKKGNTSFYFVANQFMNKLNQENKKEGFNLI